VNKLVVLIVIVLNTILHSAYALELQGQLTQGSLIRGQTLIGTKIWLNNEVIDVSVDGYFAFGFGRDAKLKHTLKWTTPDGKEQTKILDLVKRTYDIQRIDGLPSKFVSPPKEVTKRIRLDNSQVAKARSLRDQRTDFMQTFIWPAKGPISGVYGSQRVLNDKPKRPHFGVDVAGPVGTPVVAPADGIVTLWVADMYYSGGTMIIDHGFGISSTFLHLEASHVKKGDKVTQGQLVAEIGATGRVTGAHLDWRINWKKQRLDPALLVPPRVVK